MDIYEFDFVALLFFIFGVYAIVKGRLELTLSAGPSGMKTMVDESHRSTKSKKVNLGPISCRVLGVSLMAISYFIFINVKGDFLFSI